MSDDTRRHYDRAAADWWTASEAVSAAGGPAVTIPTLQLATILHGYRQLTAERDAALKLADTWQRAGLTDNFATLAMYHALGVISEEEWDGHVRRAYAVQPGDRAPSETTTDRTAEWTELLGRGVTVTYIHGGGVTGFLASIDKASVTVEVDGDQFSPPLHTIASVVSSAGRPAADARGGTA